MKLFEVRYSGLWLGGKAIVWANSPEEAIETVRCDSATIEFTNVRVSEIPEDLIVIHNDNGTY